jgi:hypothetical protein
MVAPAPSKGGDGNRGQMGVVEIEQFSKKRHVLVDTNPLT